MKNTSILITFFIFVLFLSSCPRDTGKVFYDTKIYTDTIVRVDTFRVRELQVDTITLTQYDTIINDISYPINKYEYNVNDSLLTAKITLESVFKPRNLDIDYTVKTFEVKDSIYTPVKRNFFYGGEVHALPLLNGAYVTLGYQDRKRNLYTVSVGNVNKINILKVGFLKKF
tara:strand:+ start:52 stop:564 length:513 start_codon:yes stop_codon:yes gene_type:complete